MTNLWSLYDRQYDIQDMIKNLHPWLKTNMHRDMQDIIQNIELSPLSFVGFLFLISCMSVSPLVSLLPYWNQANTGITPVLNEIYFWIFGDIPKICVHFFKIDTNFLYVCQSITWLTSLLKLGYYKDISSCR